MNLISTLICCKEKVGEISCRQGESHANSQASEERRFQSWPPRDARGRYQRLGSPWRRTERECKRCAADARS